jgi:hypothetical protein
MSVRWLEEHRDKVVGELPPRQRQVFKITHHCVGQPYSHERSPLSYNQQFKSIEFGRSTIRVECIQEQRIPRCGLRMG